MFVYCVYFVDEVLGVFTDERKAKEYKEKLGKYNDDYFIEKFELNKEDGFIYDE